jgi:hypothetical protein
MSGRFRSAVKQVLIGFPGEVTLPEGKRVESFKELGRSLHPYL